MFKTKKELKNWLENYITNRGKKSLQIAIRNSKSIKEDIIKYTNFLPENTKFNQRCFHILNDINTIIYCKECVNSKVNFDNNEWKYFEFCSTSCSTKNIDTQKKLKKTIMDKYEVDNISKSSYFKDIMMKNNNEKYGVDWYQQSDDFKTKSKITCLKKYGFDSYSKTEEFILKIKAIMLEKYGVDWYSKSKEFKEKFENTSMLKYGFKHPMMNKDLQQSVSKTVKEKYGVDWYVLTEHLKNTPVDRLKGFEKKELKYGHVIAGYKLKKYTMPSGAIVKIQGYENFAIDLLLEKYKEEDLSITYYDIKEEIGILNYIMEEKDKIYLPDIYLKSENKIIEVKSEYTYDIEKGKNELKKQACIDIGINFEFWIFNKKGKLLEIK